jgi:ribosomal protein L28
VTGISRREFKPNLQRVRITTPNGTNRYARVCTRCLKKGVVRKAIQQAPFKLPVSALKAQQPAKPAAAGAAGAKGSPAAAPIKAAAPAKGASSKAAPAKAAPTKNGPAKGK